MVFYLARHPILSHPKLTFNAQHNHLFLEIALAPCFSP